MHSERTVGGPLDPIGSCFRLPRGGIGAWSPAALLVLALGACGETPSGDTDATGTLDAGTAEDTDPDRFAAEIGAGGEGSGTARQLRDTACDLGGNGLGLGPMPTCADFAEWNGYAPEDGPLLTTPAFVDVSSQAGLPAYYAVTTSVGDVNGDGTPDLFSPGALCGDRYPTSTNPERTSEVFLNCDGRFHPIGLNTRARAARALRDVSHASHIADIDRDGLADLVFANATSIRVAFQESDGSFSVVTAWTRTDAYTSHPYPSVRSLAVFDVDRDGLPDILGAQYGGENPLVLSRAGRTFVDATFEHALLAANGDGETYALAIMTIPGETAYDYLYVGNHARPDAVFRIQEGPHITRIRDDYEPFSTMGVDYVYRGSGLGPLIATSDDGPFFLAGFDGSALTPLTERMPIPTGYTFWGMRFADFDNDAAIDLVVGSGRLEADPEFETWRNGDNRLFMMDGTLRGYTTWSDAGAHAGPAFDGSEIRDYYSVTSADLDADGCLDLVVTPLDRTSMRDAEIRYSTPVRILRNRCHYGRLWVGFRIDDDPGTRVALHLRTPTSGVVELVRSAKPAAGIGSGGPLTQIHFGLGGLSVVADVTVRCRDGRETTFLGREVTVGAYNDLRGSCPPP